MKQQTVFVESSESDPSLGNARRGAEPNVRHVFFFFREGGALGRKSVMIENGAGRQDNHSIRTYVFKTKLLGIRILYKTKARELYILF